MVKTTKKVRVPCHRNTYKQYTVQVPRTVTERVPKTVNYTDYENRTKQVPYQCSKTETRTRTENQPYTVQVQVPRTTTKMVTVTKKVPKTIFVDVTTQVPKQCQTMVTETQTRNRLVTIPYTVQVPTTKYRTVNYKEPVQRTKTEMVCQTKTVYDTQVRTKCEPKMTWVTKEIPVYNVVAKPAAPCPPEGCGPSVAPISGGGQYRSEFNALDLNNDGKLDYSEYAAARSGGDGGQGYNQGSSGGYGGGVAAPINPQPCGPCGPSPLVGGDDYGAPTMPINPQY